MPFGEWMDHWYQYYSKPKIQATTQAAYEVRIYNHVIPDIGHIPLNKLTQNDLQQYYTRLKHTGRLIRTELYGEGLSDRMIRGIHASCRAGLQKAVEDGLIRVNPAIGCKLPPKKAREMQVLTREEMQRFLIQAKAEGYYELFLLELSTGLRRGELMTLQWDDLNFDTGELRINKQIGRIKGRLTVTTPKTKTSIRTIILPPPLLKVLKEYKETVNSRWLFPSPVKEDIPMDPANVRGRLHLILEHAGCKQVRFHDLRHTFSTMALEAGMDVKTLSALLGHVSSATTLDIYTHITDDMQRNAAAHIDRGIGKTEPLKQPEQSAASEQQPYTPFVPYHGKKRRPGTGCITQISDHLWEGRYSPMWPDGKKHSRNIYGKTREEVEAKLPGLIAEMQAEIKAIKDGEAGAVIPDGVSKKKRAVWDYMLAHPEVTNKSEIAKGAGVDRSTVRRHYDDIRKEIAHAKR